MSAEISADRTIRNCDIVMKGGIVSGVVYPKAIATLSTRFYFKNIGGTSAGAIAAAAAAAAEYARQSKKTNDGFEELKRLPSILGEKIGRKTRLFNLFQPQPITAAPFRVMSMVLNANGGFWRSLRFVSATLLCYWPYSLLGIIPGGILLGTSFAFTRTNGLSVAAFVISIVIASLMMMCGAIASSIFFLILRTRSALCRNNYGICNGMSHVPDDKSDSALTPWLDRYLNGLAGIPADRPLTFGDLWHAGIAPGIEGFSDKPADRVIQLQMYTTCLTHGRPYRLPFEQPDTVFYFRPDEFETLFPSHVVKWMIDHQPKKKSDRDFTTHGFYKIPDPADLPVIVATRLSLSFPVLLSAIPLYAVDYTLKEQSPLLPERCWFSDGGISSNFPVHFFDSPLPRWPTFCINLGEQRIDESAANLDIPSMVSNNGSGLESNWNRFDLKRPVDSVAGMKPLRPKPYSSQLLGFSSAILWSAKNWSDEVLSAMPGFRDRIATVRLAPNEGLLNLNMDSDTIERLAERGNVAALRFITRFAPKGRLESNVTSDAEPRAKDSTGDTTMTWENHRWVRLRSFLFATLQTLKSVERSCRPQENEVGFEDLLGAEYKEPSYEIRSKQVRQQLAETLTGLRKLSEAWTEQELHSEESMAPCPRPELRTRPRI